MLHDIGKYSEEFQKKINEDTNNMVDHATAGAQLCKKINLPVLDYCIAGHHAGLPDYGNTAERSSLCGRYKKKIYNYEAYQEEIKIPVLQQNDLVEIFFNMKGKVERVEKITK